MNPNIENFLYSKSGQQRAILLYLHQILAEELALGAKIRYKIPFYYHHSWICYLNPIKADGIELAFLQGKYLSNAQGLIDMKDRKQVGGISIYKVEDIHRDTLYEIIQEALIIDEEMKG